MQGSTRGVPIDTDNTLSLDSDIVVPSQKAIKAHVANTFALAQPILGYTPLNVAGDTMIGYLVLNADPTNLLGAATKQYVDNIVSGINFHTPVHAATTANLSATYANGVSGIGATLTATANGAIIVDGHTLLTSERVLVWQQTSALQNGIYSVTQTGSVSTPFILTRATDGDQYPSEMSYGDFCFVQQGTSYGGYGFINNTSGTITIGVTAISYIQFNAAQVVAAGYGLLESTPNVLSVDTTVIAPLNSPAFTGTVTGITATMVGLGSVVNIDTTTTANITDSTNKRFLTDAQLAVVSATTGTNTGDETTSSIKTKLGAATSLVDGYLTSADWSTFNGKQAALSGTGFVKSTAGVISYDTSTYLTSISSGDVTTALGYTPVTDARTISTTAPLTGGGDLSANRTFAITQSTTSTDGYLSSTDWNTFNNKTTVRYNNATGTQSITAATVTYLTNSDISTANIKAGTMVTWTVSISKTAAGTATPIWTVRFGTNASTSDSTLLTYTGSTQTAAADTALVIIRCVFRSVGSGTSAVLFGHYALNHHLTTTGFSSIANNHIIATSSGFDSTTANAFLGLTVNSGASAAWTINMVNVQIENIT